MTICRLACVSRRLIGVGARCRLCILLSGSAMGGHQTLAFQDFLTPHMVVGALRIRQFGTGEVLARGSECPPSGRAPGGRAAERVGAD